MKMEDDRDNPFARVLMQSYERNLQSILFFSVFVLHNITVILN